MKIKSIAAILFCLTAATAFAGTNDLAIIPLPQKIEMRDDAFRLGPKTRIVTDFGSRATGKYLAEKLRPATGFSLKVGVNFFGRPVANAISLTTKSANTNLGAEGYELTVFTNSVVIRAPTQAGLFYGVQTLRQLLPPEIFSSNVVANVNWQMPCVQIEDWPRFKWRGFMLDVARHFYNKQEVERILDAMALQKLNRFHWHLTDDQGWRIEIKKYPKLTQIGAWRSGVGFNLDPKSTTAYGPDGRYGGFYTPADIREVVKYAAARHITIVPEIEMPGHSTAALMAYPQFSATGGPFTTDLRGGVFNGIYCTGDEGTYVFLQNILKEVFQLFPGKYIHIGGDEVPTDVWEKSAKDQAVVKREHLKGVNELEGYFIRRMEKFINSQGRTLVGWNENNAPGGFAQNGVVMDWTGGAREAASAGHDVVMTPAAYCYFDFYQSANHASEPKAQTWGGPISLEKVYSFEPIPAGLPPRLQSHILGAQANLWTELIPNLHHAEYMMFPRLCALAEVTWSAKDSRNYQDFSRRLQIHAQRLDELGINYRRQSVVNSGN